MDHVRLELSELLLNQLRDGKKDGIEAQIRVNGDGEPAAGQFQHPVLPVAFESGGGAAANTEEGITPPPCKRLQLAAGAGSSIHFMK